MSGSGPVSERRSVTREDIEAAFDQYTEGKATPDRIWDALHATPPASGDVDAARANLLRLMPYAETHDLLAALEAAIRAESDETVDALLPTFEVGQVVGELQPGRRPHDWCSIHGDIGPMESIDGHARKHHGSSAEDIRKARKVIKRARAESDERVAALEFPTYHYTSVTDPQTGKQKPYMPTEMLAAPATPPASGEAACAQCGGGPDTPDHGLGGTHAWMPVGAYVASALMAANIECDSGEDVDRFLAELARRGFAIRAESGGLDVERLARSYESILGLPADRVLNAHSIAWAEAIAAEYARLAKDAER